MKVQKWLFKGRQADYASNSTCEVKPGIKLIPGDFSCFDLWISCCCSGQPQRAVTRSFAHAWSSTAMKDCLELVRAQMALARARLAPI